MAHPNGGGLQVNVIPLQAEQLASPHAGVEGENVEGFETISPGTRQARGPPNPLLHSARYSSVFLEMLLEEGVHPLAVDLPVGEVGVAVACSLQQPQLLGSSSRLIEP